MKKIKKRHQKALNWIAEVLPMVQLKMDSHQKEGRYINIIRAGEDECEIMDENKIYVFHMNQSKC